MSDVLDIAKDISDMHAAAALKADYAAKEKRVHVRTSICIDCGKEIPPARLKAAPLASRCVKCQAAYEGRNGKSVD